MCCKQRVALCRDLPDGETVSGAQCLCKICTSMNSLTLDDFHLFSRIAATQSLSEVARERNVAASQISRGLRRIEMACGLRLGGRTPHRPPPTQEGGGGLGSGPRVP